METTEVGGFTAYVFGKVFEGVSPKSDHFIKYLSWGNHCRERGLKMLKYPVKGFSDY